MRNARKGKDTFEVALSAKGKSICITEVADDMYKAIDSAKDRLARQLKREREKRREGRHNGDGRPEEDVWDVHPEVEEHEKFSDL